MVYSGLCVVRNGYGGPAYWPTIVTAVFFLKFACAISPNAIPAAKFAKLFSAVLNLYDFKACAAATSVSSTAKVSPPASATPSEAATARSPALQT